VGTGTSPSTRSTKNDGGLPLRRWLVEYFVELRNPMERLVSERLPDIRRVCDLSPLQLLEAAFQACSEFGWTSGHWAVELHVEDGAVRRALPRLVDGMPARAAVGRRQLDGHQPTLEGEAA
jgi:hypothetical protein